MQNLNKEVKPLLQDKNLVAASHLIRAAAVTPSASLLQNSRFALALAASSPQAIDSLCRALRKPHTHTSAPHITRGKSRMLQGSTCSATLANKRAIEAPLQNALAWERPASPSFLDL